MSLKPSTNQKYWLLLLYIAIVEMIFYCTITPDKTITEILIEQKDLLEYPCCIPDPNDTLRTNLIFLKTNGTWSSYVFDILARFSLSYSLNVFIPESNDNSTLRPANGTETKDDKYNMLFEFGKFNPEVYKYAFSNAFTVTILRDPVSTFESYYNDYRNNTFLGSFKDFVTKILNSSEFTLNPISTQLGLPKEHQKDEVEIQKFIREIESKFDLVMIYERLDVSLVLLANLLGWPLQYMTSFSQITPIKYTFKDVEKITISEMNMADVMLHDYFFNKLDNCALQYGVNQIVSEMNMIALYDRELISYCSMENQTKEDAPGFYWGCNNYLESDERFLEEIKEEQKKRIEQGKSDDYFIIF